MSTQPTEQQPSNDGAPTPPSFLDSVLADLNRPSAPAIPPVVKPSLPKSIPPIASSPINGSKATEPASPPGNNKEDAPPRAGKPDDTAIPEATRSVNDDLPTPPKEVDERNAPSSPATSDQHPEPIKDGSKPPAPDDTRDEFSDKDLATLEDMSEQPAPPRERHQTVEDEQSDPAQPESPLIQPAIVAPPSGKLPLPEVPPRDDTKSNRSTQWALIGTALLIFFNIALIAFIAFILFGRDQSPPPPTTDAPRVARPAPIRPTEPAPPLAIREQPDSPTRPEEPVEEAVPPSPPTFTIPKLELIRAISGFGQYDRLPDAPLRPRHLPHIQTYVEMANLSPEPRDDDRYNYYVSMRVKMYRADVGPSEPLMDTTISHVFRGYSPRRDFYLTHALQSSRRIQPGEHIVAVRVVDQISRAVAQEQTAFVITSEP